MPWLICIFQVSPVNEPYQTLVSLRQSILCGYDNFTFFILFYFIYYLFFFWGGGGGLNASYPTGFEAFGPPVKDFALGVSVVILDGASIVSILKGVGSSTVQ